MKRPYRFVSHAYAVWPLFFWVLCTRCSKDFRREWGWAADGIQRSDHVCASCCPTREDAMRYFNREGPYDVRPLPPQGGSGTAPPRAERIP